MRIIAIAAPSDFVRLINPRLVAHVASAWAFSAATSLCFTIYAHWHWNSDMLVAPDGKIAVYRILSLVLLTGGTGCGARYYLGPFRSSSHQALLVCSCATVAAAMYVFVMTASATTFALLYPGICALVPLSIIAGAASKE